MIKPTVGRVVWVRGRPDSTSGEQPEVALITYVHSDYCINVAGFDKNGQRFAVLNIALAQEGVDGAPEIRAEWMPYQLGQARRAKAEDLATLEQRLG